MNKLINKLLSVLKGHVNQNNKEIQLNQQDIDKLLVKGSGTVKKKDLDDKYALNRQLLDENTDFVKMQLELTDFLNKYDFLFTEQKQAVTDFQQDQDDDRNLFRQTINGNLKFDAAHPQYNNPRFFNDLLQYYEQHENYEMCDKLLKTRKLSS